MVAENLVHRFSLIVLNGQDALHMTTTKKIALRCMAAAVVLETYLNLGFTEATDKPILQNDLLAEAQKMPYRETVLKPLLNKGGNLKWWLKNASSLPKRQLVALERAIADELKAANLLEEIPHLLGCDLYYHTAGVKIKQYRCNVQEYAKITEGTRANILKDGAVTDEIISLLWLLRESGCLHELFSGNELEKVATRMNELYQSVSLAKLIFPINIHHGIEVAIKEFLRKKRSILKTPVGTGVNFALPMLERSQSIFIETETWFADSKQIIDSLKKRLIPNGHTLLVLNEGKSPLVKIDNTVYQAIPQAIPGKVPIHGVRLLPRRPI